MMRIFFHKRAQFLLPIIITNLLECSKDAYLAGGVIRSYFDGTKVEDYDFFFKNQKAVTLFVELLKLEKFKLVYECSEGKLFTFKHKNMKIQVVCERYYSNEEELINSFDITACMFVLDCYMRLHTYKESIKAAKNKELRINKVEYPLATMNRIDKYVKKGYYFSNEDKLDFIKMIQNFKSDKTDAYRVYID